ncbi:MAG TPA: aminotransferase class III-fold pyridoxal phosphate-dependent enzyme [Bacteroidota bacterium]|nr:aminotransferase class III-fold pyridoxal phosphate-dependent enzyme [Bacteroidota bacterium]
MSDTNIETRHARIVTNVPGPQSLRHFSRDQRFIAPGIQTIATLSQLTIERGNGCILEDVDGNRYIDFFAGVGVASLGYNHPSYVSAMQYQVSMNHVGSFTSRARADLSELLSTIAVGDLTRTQYYSSGAEAVEAALRLAKSYTKKTEFIGFWGGFHGKTLGVLGLLGDSFKHELGPLPFGMYSSPYADCRKCPFNLTVHDCAFACVDFLRKKIRHETTGSIAAIIVEPIQGTAGNIIPPRGFLRELKALAKEIGALLIADEMITGFGRTGRMFACEHEPVVPDIITIGKGFGGGFPVTGLMSREDIVFSKPFSLPSGSSSSYGGNPFAAAAALATVRTIIDDGLVENSARVGSMMLERLSAFGDRFPFVDRVQGKGLMIGMHLIRPGEPDRPLDKQYTQLIFRECLKRGLILMGYNADIRINPPLIITEEIAEEGIEIMEEVFAYAADRIDTEST